MIAIKTNQIAGQILASTAVVMAASAAARQLVKARRNNNIEGGNRIAEITSAMSPPLIAAVIVGDRP